MTITQVNKTTFTSTSTIATQTNTFGWTANAGNLLVACITSNNTFSVTAGWIRVANPTDFAECDIWYKVSNGGETSLAVTAGGACVMIIGVTEWSSTVDGSWALDKSVSANNTATTAQPGTTAATVNAEELAVYAFGNGGGGASAYTGTTTGTITTEFNGAESGNTNFLLYASRILSATGTVTATATSGLSSHHSSVIATFQRVPKAPLFVCGAECGIAAVGTLGPLVEHWGSLSGVAPTVVTSGPASMRSTRAYRWNVSGSASGGSLNYNFSTPIASPATMVARFYVYFATLPDFDCILLQMTSFPRGIGYKASDSTIRTMSNSGLNTVGGVVVTTGQWYCVDCRITLDTVYVGAGEVDGVALPAMGGAGTAATISGFQIGPTPLISTVSTDIYFDDIIVGGTIADYPFGEGNVAGLYPNADVSPHGGTWTAGMFGKGTGGATNANRTDTDLWQSLQKPLSTTIPSTFIADKTATGTDYVQFTFDNLPGTATFINGVMYVATTHSAAATTNAFTLAQSDASGNSTALVTAADLSDTTIGVPTVTKNTDAVNSVWTPTKIDNSQIRFSSTDVNPDVYLDGICMEVDYVSTPAGPSGPISPVTLTLTAQTITAVATGDAARSITNLTTILTPVALTTSIGAVTASISPVTVTLTPIPLTGQATIDPQFASITPVTMTLGAQPLVRSVGDVNRTLTSVTFTYSTIALVRSVGDVNRTLTNVTFTLTPVALVRSVSGVTTSISPIQNTFIAVALTSTIGTVSVTLSPTTITLSTLTLTYSVGGTASTAINSMIMTLIAGAISGSTPVPGVGTVSPVTITLTPVALVRSVGGTASGTLGIVTITLTPVLLVRSVGGITSGITPTTFTLTPVVLSRAVGTASNTLTPAIFTLTPVALVLSVGGTAARSITTAIFTLTAQPIVALSAGMGAIIPATFTLTLVALTRSVGGTASGQLTPATFTFTPVVLVRSVGDVARTVNPTIFTFTARPIVGLSAGMGALLPITLTLTPVALVPAIILGGKPKVWTGTVWVAKPVKVWNGSAWVEKPMKVWTGSTWELV